MSIQQIVLLWLAEYCCFKKYPDGFQAIVALARKKSVDIANKINSTRLATLLLYEAVNKKFEITKFHTVINTVNELYNLLPSHAVTFKLYAKVTTGLKILVLFDMLKDSNKFVLPRLNEFFPRTGVNHPKADKALAGKLSAAQLKFRRFLLSMIASKSQQQAYFREEYDKEYGQEFRDKVKYLMQQYINAIEQLLPAPHIDRLAAVGRGGFDNELQKFRSPVMNLLLDMCEKKYLTEKEIADLAKAAVLDQDEHDMLLHKEVSTVQNKSPVRSGSSLFNVSPIRASTSPGSSMPSVKLAHNNPVKTHAEIETSDTLTSKIQKTVTVDVCHCLFETSQPSYEMFSPVVGKKINFSSELGKTQVPLGKVYRMNYRPSKQIKQSSSRSLLTDKVESVYKTIQTSQKQRSHSSTVDTTSAGNRQKSRKRLRSRSPEDGVSTSSQDVRGLKNLGPCVSESVEEDSQHQLSVTAGEKYPLEIIAVKNVKQKPVRGPSGETSDQSQHTEELSPEQVYTISSSSGCEESQQGRGRHSQQQDTVSNSHTHTQTAVCSTSDKDTVTNTHTQTLVCSTSDEDVDKSMLRKTGGNTEGYKHNMEKQRYNVDISSTEGEIYRLTSDTKGGKLLPSQSAQDKCTTIIEGICVDDTKATERLDASTSRLFARVVPQVDLDMPGLQDDTVRLDTAGPNTCTSKRANKKQKKRLADESFPSEEKDIIASCTNTETSSSKRRNIDSGMSYNVDHQSGMVNLDPQGDCSFTCSVRVSDDSLIGKETGEGGSYEAGLLLSHKPVMTEQQLQPTPTDEVPLDRGSDSCGISSLTDTGVKAKGLDTSSLSPKDIGGRVNGRNRTISLNAISPGVHSQSSETSFYSCVTSPQQHVLSEDDLISTPYKSALDLPNLNDESVDISNTTLVEDSENEMMEMHVDTTILPSSNSMDQYDAVLEFGKDTLPQLDRYLRDDKARLCVVKLFRDEDLDHVIDSRRHIIYS